MVTQLLIGDGSLHEIDWSEVKKLKMIDLRTNLGAFFCFVFLLFLPNASADIKLPKNFSDSMVVQRQKEFPVWGEAVAKEALTVSIQQEGLEKTQLQTTADDKGNWKVTFPPLKVGKPYTLTVQGKDSTVVVRDILAGDVWLCSGQSNMEWPIRRLPNAKDILKRVKENKNLRLFTINKLSSPQPLAKLTGVRSWKTANAKTVENFSAVAYFFGHRLQSQSKVPIGLIHSSWGGSSCEAWVSRPGLEAEKKFGKMIEVFGNPENATQNCRLSRLYNGMIAPISRVKIKGVIWYQGETNVTRGRQYLPLFSTLIKDWRKTFGDKDLPFLFVQLAPFQYSQPEFLPEIWDAQLKTYKSVANTGMVVITDLGDAKDIHPAKKQPVGRRLADFAFAEVYEKKGSLIPRVTDAAKKDSAAKTTPTSLSNKSEKAGLQKTSKQGAAPTAKKADYVYCGPIYKSFSKKANTIEIEFYIIDGVLKSKDGKPLREFTIAGKDQKFVPAKAEIVNGKVVVSSPQIKDPVAVRFCWRDTPDANLVGSTLLPASPFRTDNFPLLSKDKEY